MFWIAAIVGCVVSADVRPPSDLDAPTKLKLVLTPNTSNVLQHDSLLVRIVLEVAQTSDAVVVVEPPHELGGYYFRLEVREGDGWRRIRSVREESLGPGCEGSARCKFAAGSRYAEYNWFHVDHGSYIFSRQGKCELRAVANLKTGELVSEPVTITVGPRTSDDLERIEKGTFVTYISRSYLNWPGPNVSRDFESLGGNLGTTIKNFTLLQELIRTGRVAGVEVEKEKAIIELKRKMDPIMWEHALTILGQHFAAKRDLESLTGLVRATPPFDSRGFLSAAGHLKDLREKLAEEAKTAGESNIQPATVPK